jgi:hypothetical protein
MRRSFLCATILALLLAVPGAAAPRLEGCLTESAIASAAAKLAQEDWHNVSLAKLRTIWPTELSGLNCDADVCHSVWSMDRIIGGQCQCCATFAFKIHQAAGGAKVEQLDEVVLNYSAAERDRLVEATRKIVSAMGLSGADLATVGSADEQNFHWANTAVSEREMSAVEVRFKHQGNVWKLFLNWGRIPAEPSAKPQ